MLNLAYVYMLRTYNEATSEIWLVTNNTKMYNYRAGPLWDEPKNPHKIRDYYRVRNYTEPDLETRRRLLFIYSWLCEGWDPTTALQ